MDEFEKVEKLRQRADVSYEDAKNALNAANGDLLDAMIYLEKQGKTQRPESNSSEKVNETEKCLPACCEKKAENKDKSKCDGSKFKGFCKDAWQKGNDNEFIMRRHDEVIIRIPVWALVVILLLTFQVTLPLMLISLFFGCKYGFEGKDDLSKANDVMDQVSETAERFKDEMFKDKE